jgi:hypothetical protein
MHAALPSAFSGPLLFRVADPPAPGGSGFWLPFLPVAHKLIRHYWRGDLHFITFTCYRRLPLLRSVRARNALVKILGETRDRYGFYFVGYVVMREHIHLLIGEPAKGTPSTP